jgi:hypothetical protein
MGLSNDMRKMGDLYFENLGLGPQAIGSMQPSPTIPVEVRQDPSKIKAEFLSYLKGLQGPEKKKLALEVLDIIL